MYPDIKPKVYTLRDFGPKGCGEACREYYSFEVYFHCIIYPLDIYKTFLRIHETSSKKISSK